MTIYFECSAYDAQRIHFKQLEDAERDKYQQKIKDMQTAGMNTMKEQLDYKRSEEAARKAYEINRDNVDLNTMNRSALNPSATMTAGPFASFTK